MIKNIVVKTKYSKTENKTFVIEYYLDDNNDFIDSMTIGYYDGEPDDLKTDIFLQQN